MVTITKKINLYEYNELSEKAKERAKQDFLETRCELDGDMFTEIASDAMCRFNMDDLTDETEFLVYPVNEYGVRVWHARGTKFYKEDLDW